MSRRSVNACQPQIVHGDADVDSGAPKIAASTSWATIRMNRLADVAVPLSVACASM
jgi:hypothetical protein